MKSVTSKIRSSGFGRAFISADCCPASNTSPQFPLPRRRVLGAIAACALPGMALAARAPLQIGFVYVTPLTDVGWVRQHEAGRLAVQAVLGEQVQTRFVENVAEGPDAERVIRELAHSGCALIFTPSFGYMEPTLRVAREFPDVRFESITGYKTAPNVGTANARYYEGRYLAGVAAGRMTRSGQVGFVAGFPIPEVLQGINAFTLGLRSVAREAQVRIIWLQEWFAPPRERDAAMTLFDQGVDVMAFHTGSSAVMAAAEERGRLAVAYHSDMRHIGPRAQLVAVRHEWGDYYTRRARAVLDGSWRSSQVWGGVREGMIRVGDFGSRVPEAVRQEVDARQRDIAQGRLHPFRAGATALRDSGGRTVVEAGQTLSDAQILAMDWLAEGVVGGLPR